MVSSVSVKEDGQGTTCSGIPNEEHVRKLASCMMNLQSYRSDGSDLSDTEVSECSSASDLSAVSDIDVDAVYGQADIDDDQGPVKTSNEILPEVRNQS